MTASDQRIPGKSDVATVFVTVIRDNQDPVFTLPNYEATIVETSPVSSSVITVEATDADLSVSPVTWLASAEEGSVPLLERSWIV